MNLYETFEEAIKTQLGVIAGCDIVVMPESTSEYAKPVTGTASRITVAYAGSVFSNKMDVHNVIQTETHKYQIIVEAKKRRGSSGIYELISLVRKRLLGYAPNGDGFKLYFEPDREGVLPELKTDDIFMYSLIMCVQQPVVEEVADPEFDDAVGLEITTARVTEIGEEPSTGIGFDRIGENNTIQ